MAQIFHPSFNTISKVSIFGAVFFLGAGVWAWDAFLRSPYTTQVGVARTQPVPFSHKHHVQGLGIDCRFCHASVEQAAFAGIPASKTCMSCHALIWKDSAVLEPVRESFRTGTPIRWTRVHDLPDYVHFDHSIHVAKGVGCASCHGRIDRREFLQKSAAVTIGGLAMAQALLPRYANAQTISFTDQRIKARYVSYPSLGGTSGTMRGYLVQPSGSGPFPTVMVIHENRGLNPYIEDVARRAAVEGFLALAPDGLSPVGGYPGNDEQGVQMQRKLEAPKIQEDFVAGTNWLRQHQLTTGRVGIVGFCFGGGMANTVAVRVPELGAAVPFYGGQPRAEDVPKINALLLIHYAENDQRINGGWPAYEAALKANNGFRGYFRGGQFPGHPGQSPPSPFDVEPARPGQLWFRCHLPRCQSAIAAAIRAPAPSKSRISHAHWLPSILL